MSRGSQQTPWTPGPWEYNPGKGQLIAAERTMVAIPWHEDDQGDYDAELIALAPEMAEAILWLWRTRDDLPFMFTKIAKRLEAIGG